MRLTPGVTIEGGMTVTRQTLFDLWSNAEGAVVVGEDLAQGTFPILVGSNLTTSAGPGQIVYDQTEMLWMCYFDQVDYTGVSLWMSIGPDRFDDAFLASEPLPPGALFRFDSNGTGRMVVRAAGYAEPKSIGIVASLDTVASGHWFTGTVEGFVKAWFTARTAGAADPAANLSGARMGKVVFPCGWAPGGLCRSSSGEGGNQFIVGKALHDVEPATTVSFGNVLARILFFGSRFSSG